MTGVIQFGPLALATDRILAVAAIWAFAALVPWLLGANEERRNAITWLSLGVGILAARIGYVASHWSAFAAEPATMLYVWQGGFSAIAGIAAAVVVLAVALRTVRPRARALAATAAVAGMWFATTIAVAAGDPPLLPQGLSTRQMDGRTVALDDLRGRPFVLNLWATWCPPCQREMPMLASVARSRPNPPILFVNQGADAATVARVLQENDLRLPASLLDRSGSFGRALGGGALPATIFVDAAGRIRLSHFGEISRAGLEEGLDQISTKD
ncbi:TlpA family protein disulfide reductase [Sphingomonas parva]|uniref:TlpA family protein disulfide reductase n=1 Tax=Sphingomonas parva TaxID=2555898 RepID=A0A4Y8ZV07_9SPHN|nr:TlpA disulfide reductase family protein [Sphingomonas parva]TFI59744.1 TlpA family protein disulfide reductase [Sphingomonas parva]